MKCNVSSHDSRADRRGGAAPAAAAAEHHERAAHGAAQAAPATAFLQAPLQGKIIFYFLKRTLIGIWLSDTERIRI
jgi:hypothetical protein